MATIFTIDDVKKFRASIYTQTFITQDLREYLLDCPPSEGWEMRWDLRYFTLILEGRFVRAAKVLERIRRSNSTDVQIEKRSSRRSACMYASIRFANTTSRALEAKHKKNQRRRGIG